jgi:CheY-like chemotaxis protein
MLIRERAVDVLQEAGFLVIAAEDACEAVNILKTRSPEVCVMFSDIHMPGGMNGVELASHVKTCWPWIEIMLTSGKARPDLDGIISDVEFFQKPYAIEETIGRVRDVGAAR